MPVTGMIPMAMPDVHEHVEEDHGEDPRSREHRVVFAGRPDDADSAQEDREKQPEDQEGAEEAPFLREDRKYEIRALLGKELVMALRAVQPTLSVQAAGADGGHGLDDVPARPLGIDLRVDEDHQPHDLVVLQDDTQGDGQEPPGDEQRRRPGDPEEVPLTERPPAQKRQPGDHGGREEEVLHDVRVGEQPEEGRAAEPCARVQRGDRGQDECKHAGEQDEQEVADLRAGDESHQEEYGKERQGLSHVRLQEDQGDRHENDHEAEEKTRKLSDAVADAREIRGEEEDRGDLHELGGLDADLREPQPGPRAVHLPADDQGEEEKEKTRRIDVQGEHPQRRVAEEREAHEQDQAGQRPDDLAEELGRDLHAVRVDPAGVDEKDSDAEQDAGRPEKDHVEGREGELPQSTLPTTGAYQGFSVATASS